MARPNGHQSSSNSTLRDTTKVAFYRTDNDQTLKRYPKEEVKKIIVSKRQVMCSLVCTHELPLFPSSVRRDMLID